jgi:hypothetical protein
MATRSKPRGQVEIYDRVNDLVDGGTTRTDAFAQLSQSMGMRAGTLAANYYREARHRSTRKPPTTEEVTTMAPPAAKPEPDAGAEQESGDQPTLTEVPKGQLAFDGFAVSQHRVKIAGTSLDIQSDEVGDYKLGQEIEFTFKARVVKRNNHLLTDDNGSSVEHDIVCVMEGLKRA